MPTVPLVRPPIIGPSQSPNVRADPDMTEPLNRGAQHIAAAIGEFGELAAKVKHVADTSYIIGSQAKLEATHRDFQTWTDANPDPSTWDTEYQARVKGTLDQINEGGKNLSTFAKKQLSTDIGAWQIRSGADVNGMKQRQTIKNAIGVSDDSLNAAVAANDVVGAHAIIDTGLKQGLWDGAGAAAKLKRVSQGIASNQANYDLQSDPFDASAKLNAKDESGAYVNYPALPQPARVTMLFRANKLAAETRTASVRTWSQAIASAQAGDGPMPDLDGIKAEAARQGIAPKVIAKLFAPPAATDPHEFASAYTAISHYDPTTDPANEHLGELQQRIETFKGPSRERLNSLLTQKADPHSTLQKPTVKLGEDAINDMFRIGGYGVYHMASSEIDQVTGQPLMKEDPAAKQKAELVRARNLDLLHQWLDESPEKPKTREEVQKFVNGLNTNHATTGASRLLLPPRAFALPNPKH